MNKLYKQVCEFFEAHTEVLCCPFWWILLMALACLFVCSLGWAFAADEVRPSFRHDPNVTCRQVRVDNSDHPLYGMPDSLTAQYLCIIENVTGRPWIAEFSKYWLDCHPYADPLPYLDVNFDGVTDWRDFVILSRCRIVYRTRTGTKYHVRGCTYLRASAIAIRDPNGLLPCAVCIVAPAWMEE